MFPQVGDIRKTIRRGTELPEDIVEQLGVAQETLTVLADEEADPDAARAIQNAADSAGQLRLAVADAGTDYPFDRVVRARAKALSLTLVTAALTVVC